MKLATLTVCALVATSANTVSAQTIGIDFGDINNWTGGNYNNIDHLQNPLFNLIDFDGNGTGISANVSDNFWPGSNQGGTAATGGAASGVPGSAASDNLFGSLVDFGGFLEPTGGVTFDGLDTSGNTAYNFMFFASRMNVSDNREALYTLDGLNSGSTTLDAANNTDNVAFANGIIPDASGAITLGVTAGPNNTNSSGFYYLGYVEITAVPVPAPASASLIGLGSIVALRRRRHA